MPLSLFDDGFVLGGGGGGVVMWEELSKLFCGGLEGGCSSSPSPSFFPSCSFSSLHEGRYVPLTELLEYKERQLQLQKQKQQQQRGGGRRGGGRFNDWFQQEMSVGEIFSTEINLQLGICIKRGGGGGGGGGGGSLERGVVGHPLFKMLYGPLPDNGLIHCFEEGGRGGREGRVRRVISIPSRKMVLEIWEGDGRSLPLPPLSSSTLSPLFSAEWAKEVWEEFVKGRGGGGGGGGWYLIPQQEGRKDTFVLFRSGGEGKEGGKERRGKGWVAVMRRFPEAHVQLFERVESGRRYFFVHSFCSSPDLALHEVPSSSSSPASSCSSLVSSFSCVSSFAPSPLSSVLLDHLPEEINKGDQKTTTTRGEQHPKNIVFIRENTINSEGPWGEMTLTESYLPPNLLTGVFPDALLSRYRFWQVGPRSGNFCFLFLFI